MQMEQKIIIPVHELAWKAQLEFRQVYSRDFAALDLDFFKIAVWCIVEDALTSRLQWCHETHTIVDHLHKIPQYRSDDKESKRLSDLLNKVAERVDDMFTPVMPETTWDLWTTQWFGSRNDILVEQGEDYRITDWRRMKDKYEPGEDDDERWPN